MNLQPMNRPSEQTKAGAASQPKPSLSVADPRLRAEREAAVRLRTDTVGAMRRMRQIVENNRLL